MLLFHFSINLLSLLALVLAIGLVVDDAIIVVENVERHIEDGMTPLAAAFQGARELASPILAITVVLIAVYLPIGFMGGLTGAIFTEFAFTLAGAVTISAVIALTLSPMMCSKMLKPKHAQDRKNKFILFLTGNLSAAFGLREKIASCAGIFAGYYRICSFNVRRNLFSVCHFEIGISADGRSGRGYQSDYGRS